VHELEAQLQAAQTLKQTPPKRTRSKVLTA
jgi:hypothetical protein